MNIINIMNRSVFIVGSRGSRVFVSMYLQEKEKKSGYRVNYGGL